MRKNKQLTVEAHGKELKHRILVVGLLYVLIFAVCYLNAADVTNVILSICEDAGFTLMYVSPTEMLVQSLRVCANIALVAVLPVGVWQITAFCLPAIESRRGRRAFCIWTCMAVVLFAVGVAVCIGILFPFVFKYLHAYSELFGISGGATVSAVLDFFLATVWVIGLLFELPAIITVLAECGVIGPQMLWRAFRPAIIIIAIISAAITPPDVISMAMVGIPLILDYLLGIFVCTIVTCRKLKGGHNE